MDFFSSTTSSQYHSYAAFTSMKDLTPPVQQHLSKVYTALAATSASAAVGVWAVMNGWLGGGIVRDIGFVGALVAIMLAMAVKTTPATRENEKWRLAYLLGFGFVEGVSVSPLVSVVFYSFPNGDQLILNATISTALIFASLSLTALTSTRRSWLFLGGFLASALSVMFWMSVARMMFGGFRGGVGDWELVAGLLVFCGFVLFDTQVIVEKAFAGHRDHLGHAVDLFTDLLSMFVRVLVWISKREQQKQQQQRDSKRRRND